MAIKAVLFDMDGVLIDTEALILAAAIAGLKEFGVEAQPDDFTQFVGAGEDKFIGGTAEMHGAKYIPEMKSRTYEIYAELLRAKPDAVYDGVYDVVNEVKSKYLCAVCSAADLVKVNHNLSAIGVKPDFFNALVTGSDVKRQKPFPDIFLTGAEKIGVMPQDCVVIEDSINGILAAKAAGMASVAVTTTFTENELKEKARPDYIIDDIRRLPNLLKGI